MEPAKEFKHPVDRGWAWAVCLGTAGANFFVTGGLRLVGLLFIELIEYFEADNALASMVVALLSGTFAICTCFGNIAGVRFGMRPVAIAGAIVTFLGMAFTVIAPTINVVLVTLGLINGIGYGLMFGPSMVMVGQYFNRRASMAGGLAVAGGSIGQLVLPYLLNFATDRYSFRGAMLLYAGIVLHAIPAMMLLRPPSFYDVKPSWKTQTKTANMEKKVNDLERKSFSSKELVEFKVNLSAKKPPEVDRNGTLACRASRTRYWLMDGCIVEKRASLFLLDAESRHLSLIATSVQDIVKEMKQLQGETEVRKPSPRQAFRMFCQKCCDSALLKNPIFTMFALGLSFGHVGYFSTCLYASPYGYELWKNKSLIAIIISVIGISDLVGRVLGGVVSGMNLIRKPYLVGGSFLISGVCTILVPFAPTMPVFFIYSVVLGLLGGSYMAQMVVLIVELFGPALLASGFGLATMFMGLFVIPVPSLLGGVQQKAGTFSASLRLSGMLLLFGGLFFCLIPLLEWYQRKKRKTREAVDERDAEGDAPLWLSRTLSITTENKKTGTHLDWDYLIDLKESKI